MTGALRAGWPLSLAVALFCGLAPVAHAEDAPANPAADKLLPAATLLSMTSKGVARGASVYIRIFKEESELEVWQRRGDGRYLHIKTYPICTWSGALGPKTAEGDMMSPEGFYAVTSGGLKPDSKYHLALNIGYPNALDRALGRTGNFIMVHGNCVSVGCFAMTDGMIEEIYAFVRDALDSGDDKVPVHVFPFRMTDANIARHSSNPALASWGPMKEAYDDFAQTYEPPTIGLCAKRYVVNPRARLGNNPAQSCPARIGKLLSPVSPSKALGLMIANEPLVASGIKTKTPVVTTTDIRQSGPGRIAADADLGAVKPFLARQ